MKAQRLRFRYRFTPDAGGLSNREQVRFWERALERAGFSVAYSEGKRPGPQIALAAPLPVGVTSECELADVFLAQPADPLGVLAALQADPPARGIEPVSVREVGVDAASLQSQLCWAEYEVIVASERAVAEAALSGLLSASTMPVELQRANKVKRYDLRPLVIDLSAAPASADRTLLTMRLRAAPDMTARADQVVAALGLPPAESIHRTRLEVNDVPEVVMAYRRRGILDENGNP